MTPFRVFLVVLMIGAAAFAAYGLFAADAAIRLPLLVAGLAVLGISSAFFGFSLAGSAVRLGEAGRGGRALLVAFFGGLFVLGAAGALGGAIILGILAAA
jgi:hypothetical protein